MKLCSGVGLAGRIRHSGVYLGVSIVSMATVVVGQVLRGQKGRAALVLNQFPGEWIPQFSEMEKKCKQIDVE